jgi:cation transport ATPase
MPKFLTDRVLRRTLIILALASVIFGCLAWLAGREGLAQGMWAAGTLPVVIGFGVSMVRDLLAGRMGVDAVAFVSMSAALLLGQNLAGVVVAVVYAGGNLLEDFAVARAEGNLKSLIDRVPRVAHRGIDSTVEEVMVGDLILVGPAR